MTKEIAQHLEAIRDRALPMGAFRRHSDVLADYLVQQFLAKIPINRWSDIVPILVFRASLVFLLPLLTRRYVSPMPIGFIGLKRDERTAIAEKYYSNLPKLNENSIIVIPDPMLGTGGTLRQTVGEVDQRCVIDIGHMILRDNFYYIGFLAAECGYREALKHIPEKNIILLAVDPELDANFYIVPGLGDFGDRYFGG